MKKSLRVHLKCVPDEEMKEGEKGKRDGQRGAMQSVSSVLGLAAGFSMDVWFAASLVAALKGNLSLISLHAHHFLNFLTLIRGAPPDALVRREAGGRGHVPPSGFAAEVRPGRAARGGRCQAGERQSGVPLPGLSSRPVRDWYASNPPPGSSSPSAVGLLECWGFVSSPLISTSAARSQRCLQVQLVN